MRRLRRDTRDRTQIETKARLTINGKSVHGIISLTQLESGHKGAKLKKELK